MIRAGTIAASLIAMIASLLSFQARADERYATFRASVCGIQFEYPRAWRARSLPPSEWRLSRTERESLQCVVVIDAPGWNAMDDHTILLRVYGEAFPEAAPKGRFFLGDDGKWRILGRANDFPVPIVTSCCFGLRGRMTYGRFQKGGTGGDQGLGEYDHVILSSKQRSVIASAPGGHTAVFDHLLRTLRIQ